MLADQPLGLAPVVLARQHAGLDHRAGQLGQQRERGDEPADRVAERLVVRERVVDRHLQAVGDAGRDRAVEELDAEALGEGGADLAPAGPVGRGDGDERRRGAEISSGAVVSVPVAQAAARRRTSSVAASLDTVLRSRVALVVAVLAACVVAALLLRPRPATTRRCR